MVPHQKVNDQSEHTIQLFYPRFYDFMELATVNRPR